MEPTDEELSWKPAVYDLSTAPELLGTSELVYDPSFPDNFVRSSSWCPDGSLALAHCENRSFQFLCLPSELGGATPPRAVLPQPAPILDFTWYPSASINNPASFCFVTSVRECPVKLLDASDGRLRASYSIVDHRERQIAPHCLAFNPTATKLYCGFEDAIEVFEVHRPGIDKGTRLFTTPSKKSKDGLKGIVSALSFCPDTATDYFAAGSLTSASFNIALLSESTGERPLMWIGADGLASGVTQLKFNPMNSSIIYGAFRRRREIFSWDLRGDVSTPLEIFQSPEDELTNQKIKFDIDLSGKWLAVGDRKGGISVFHAVSNQDNDIAGVKFPALQFDAHIDTVGSVSFHPFEPKLLSVSGSRHFEDDYSDGSSSESSDEGHVVLTKRSASQLDSTIKSWSFKGRPSTS